MGQDEHLLIKIPPAESVEARHQKKTRQIAVAAVLVSVVAALTSVGSCLTVRRTAKANEDSLRLLREERRPLLVFGTYNAKRDANSITVQFNLKNNGGSSAKKIDYLIEASIDGRLIASVRPQNPAVSLGAGLAEGGEWNPVIRASLESWTAIDSGQALLKVRLQVSYEDPVFSQRYTDTWCTQYVPGSENALFC